MDIDSLWRPLTGIGWYLVLLLEHLAEYEGLDVRLYGPGMVPHPDHERPVVDLPSGRAIETVSYEVPTNLSISRDWLIGQLRRLEWFLVAADRNRVLFAPNFVPPPRFRRARGALVITVHDLASLRFPGSLEEVTRERLGATLADALKRASGAITPSEVVRKELIEQGRCSSDAIVAISHGPGHLFNVDNGPLPATIPGRFALHVGTLEPRKNLGTLLSAWRLLRARGEDPPALVLCGPPGWNNEALLDSIETGTREGWLLYLGYVTDQTLAALYRQATLVVCPSFYEGFGLPIVEAQSAGTPVVCSDIPAFKEVAGDASLFVPAEEANSWAETLADLLRDEALRRELVARGRARVAVLDWHRTARRTVSFWFRVAGLPAPRD